MSPSHVVSRRRFLQSGAMASASSLVPRLPDRALARASAFPDSDAKQSGPLEEFGYGDVSLDAGLHEDQLQRTHAVLMGLSDDALLKPFRMMIGQPAPGEDLGGWPYSTYLRVG